MCRLRIFRTSHRQGLVAAIFCCLSSLDAAEHDWPQWRGPDRDGISKETGWYTAWPQSGPVRLWEKNVGYGYSAVSVSDGRLFTMGNRGARDTVYCLNAETGAEFWTHSYPCRQGHFKGPRMAPTIDADRVYSLSREGNLFCFSAASGEIIWSRGLQKDFRLRSHRHGMSCHPLVVDNLLILEIGAEDAAVIALDKMKGELVWRSGNEKLGYSSPVLATLGGQRCVVMLTGSALLGLNPQNGQQLWRHPWTPESQCAIATPIISGDKILLSSGYKTASALLQVKGAEVATLWQNQVIVTQYNTCVLVDGHLYGFHGNEQSNIKNQFLKCVSFETGQEVWKQAGLGKAALMYADGKLIILSELGDLVIAEASPKGYRELGRAPVVPKRCWTMPVLSDGKIYCRNERGDLVCIGISGKYRDAKPVAEMPAEKPTQVATADAAGATPKLSNKWPGTAEGLVLMWQDAANPHTFMDSAGKLREKYKLTVKGGSRIGKKAMELTGGRIVAEGANSAVFDACRKTNALALEAVLTTANLRQVGPARIISFSQDPYQRNFTLGQQDRDLVLRLRTTTTGENGMRPEVRLCPLDADRPHHVIVTYRPGRLAFYLNGRAMNVQQIRGDFSNWDASHQVVFGNEWIDERKWFGELHHVAVYSRFIGAAEAATRYKLAQGIAVDEEESTPQPEPKPPSVTPPVEVAPKKAEPPDRVDEKLSLALVPQQGEVESIDPKWREPDCRYRVRLAVRVGGPPREGLPVEVRLDVTALLRALGSSRPFDERSVRVVEVTRGELADRRVPFQFDPDPDWDAASRAAGILAFLVRGRAEAGTTRHFHLYFGQQDANLSVPAIPPLVAVQENVRHQGEDCFRITTQNAIYYYSKAGAAFSSIVDADGRDWISYRPSGGSAGSYRGIPNMAFPGGCFHPGATDCTTRLLSRGPVKVHLHSRSTDGKSACSWHIYPRHATLVVHSNGKPYWFLYEGTPGGKIDLDSDVCIRSNGEVTPAGTRWTKDVPGPEWVSFADPRLSRAIFLAKHKDDQAVDSYWPMQGQMTVFGFGRDGMKCFLEPKPAIFSIGLRESADPKALSEAIAAVLTPVAITISKPESMP